MQDSKIDLLDSASSVKKKLNKVCLFVYVCVCVCFMSKYAQFIAVSLSHVVKLFFVVFECILFSPQAFCEPGKVEGNGVLAFVKYVIFPILSGRGQSHICTRTHTRTHARTHTHTHTQRLKLWAFEIYIHVHVIDCCSRFRVCHSSWWEVWWYSEFRRLQ